MSISNDLARQGQFLFRWRSFLPLLLLLPASIAFTDNAEIINRYGDAATEIWGFIGMLVSLIGLLTRWITAGYVPAGTSGRNTTEQRAFQ